MKQFIICAFFFVSLVSFAQDQDKQPLDTAKIGEMLRDVNPFGGPNLFNYVSWQDNMMGASPEAAKMTKYADTPVSNAYGLAQIGIPIYTIKGRSLELPISLSYDSSGIKPEEISGIVGLGWSLQAGGVITRSIIGKVDDGNTIPSETLLESDAEWLATQANSSGRDSAYDLYSYNFCGHSGSFYIIPGTGIVPLEPTELVISQANGFTIIDKDGTQYIFGCTETSTRYMGSNDPDAPTVGTLGNYYNLTTAWYLTEIRSMDGTDNITISYQQLSGFTHVSHSYYRSVSFPYKYMGYGVWLTNLSGGSDPTTQFTTRQWSFTTIHTWHPYVVEAITYNGGSVSFGYDNYSQPNAPLNGDSRRSYPSFLSSITVNEGGLNGLLNWSFDRDTTGDYRLLLASVKKKGSNGSLIERWCMDYNSPNTNMGENSVDLFGYYNGASNATKAFLRPFNDTYTIPFSVANRNYNSANVGKLSLKSITTSAGSRTYYYYAPNEIATNGLSNLFSSSIQIGQRISKISTYDLSKGAEELVRQRDFSYANPGITIHANAFQMGAYISTSENNQCINGIGAGQWYGINSPVRIGTIVYNDQSNLPGMPLESARIFYQKVTEDISDGGASSIVRTVWEYNGYNAVGTQGSTPWEPSDSHDSLNTHSYGNHFHQRVPTYIPRNGTQSNPTTPLGYHIQNQNRPQLCNPTKVTQYKRTSTGQYKEVSQTEYSYDSASIYLQEGLALSLRTSPNTNGYELTTVHCLSDVDQQQVDRKIYYRRLKERIDKEYLDDNTVKSVKTTYHYDFAPGGRTSFYSGNTYYSNSTHVPAMGALQSPRQEIQVYDNDSTRTYIRNIIYPDELANLSGYGWAGSLVGLKYRQPVGEEIIIGASPTNKAGRYVTWGQVPVASWTDGVSNNTLLKPQKIEVYRNGSHVNRDVNYSLYDEAGKPLEIQAAGQPVKTYAWSYNHRFPVAEVAGMGFSQIRTTLNEFSQARMDGIANSSPSGPTSLDMRLLRSALREQLDTVLTTLHTYTLPFGLRTEEDPSGRMLQYDYDYGGRLSLVKDENGNKLQEFAYGFTNGGSGSPNRFESRNYTTETSYYWDVSYFDGLGRTLQQIAVGAATTGKDLVTPFDPDFLDHEDVREYLPYPALDGVSMQGTYRSNAMTAQQTYYGSGVKAYKENTYEISRRNRITASSLPGFTETTTTNIVTSPPGLILKLSFNPSNQTISVQGTYPMSRFKATITNGPDGSHTEAYYDEFETPYLERVKLDDSGNYACTYYIRDVWGRVVCVVPPAEAAILTTSATNVSAVNCYTYIYDNLDRVTMRKLPGRVPEFIAYNDADMPTLRKRFLPGGVIFEEFITAYDKFNRPVKEEYRYNVNAPITLAEYYYDTYPTSGFPLFSAESGYATSADTRTRGLKTAERITLLPAGVAPAELTASNTSTKALRTFHYDAKGYIIQQAETNVLGGISRTSFKYGHAGNLLQQRQRMAPGSGSSAAVLDRTYTYDTRLRLSQVTAQLNSGPQGTLYYTYDDLQRVASISRGSTSETTQYSYTLQGWLSSSISPSWKENLNYASVIFPDTDSLPGKAGLITESIEQYNISYPEIVGFSYDKAGRLTGSIRYNYNSSVTNNRTEQDITYDKSGNLLTLKRYGDGTQPPLVDSLSFSYDGPKRVGWTYDSNGNVTVDPLNGVSIAWNVINQPRTLTSGTSSTQRYYLADGTLTSTQDGSQLRIFLGDIVFKVASGGFGIESAGWEGGRLLPGAGNDKVLYYVNDHLGSVRTVKDGAGTVRQRYDYYPYGTVSRSWSSNSSSDTPDKRYRFGGKEIAGSLLSATATGSDKYLDFGARLYNPRSAMWLSQDPMAEKYYPIGPNVYCAANPVNVVDPEGKTPDTIWDVINIVYDLVAAAISAVHDDEEGVSAHLKDAAFDTAAALVPFIPAGASKGFKAGSRILNKVDDVSEVAKAADKSSDAMKALERGRETEITRLKELGFEKNTKKISSQTLSGEPITVIPDAITESSIVEIKDVKKLYRTKQIQGEFNAATTMGKNYVIEIESNTYVSKPLKHLQKQNEGLFNFHYYNK